MDAVIKGDVLGKSPLGGVLEISRARWRNVLLPQELGPLRAVRTFNGDKFYIIHNTIILHAFIT